LAAGTQDRTAAARTQGLDGFAAAAEPTTLTVVAHEDDDILFINPDVNADISAGRRMVTVFVTAGDAGDTAAYWHGREAGAMAAYASMAGARDRWTIDTTSLADHTVTRATLPGRPIVLIFLRLPDGHGYAVHDFETLQRLWTGDLPAIHAIDGSAAYDRDSLIGTLAAAMDTYRPTVIRTLDFDGRYGDGDHGDHHTVGYFTLAAQRAYPMPHTLAGYLGYPARTRPANLPAVVRDAKMRTFLAYARHDSHVCRTRTACLATGYAARFARRYAEAVVRPVRPIMRSNISAFWSSTISAP
jgi:LmbE family N-acetylglucosaminyl deacetylase